LIAKLRSGGSLEGINVTMDAKCDTAGFLNSGALIAHRLTVRCHELGWPIRGIGVPFAGVGR
jgi:hypothetical protein